MVLDILTVDFHFDCGRRSPYSKYVCDTPYGWANQVLHFIEDKVYCYNNKLIVITMGIIPYSAKFWRGKTLAN